MEQLSHRMRKDVQDIRKFLTERNLFTFSCEEKKALITDSQRLLERLHSLSEQALVVGLLGGTGVGKSTIMNALAGIEISSTSHRRPHTEQVLLYHHEQTALPPFLAEAAMPKHEIVHQAESIAPIILCDLPDFDSLVGAHNEQVLQFLEHLDVLVFVSSPEKYADNLFYAFLKQLPKAEANLYFVLNKTDLLFHGKDSEGAYQDLHKLTALFQQYLKKSEVQDPLIYMVSAQEAFVGATVSPWNQFPGLSREIFRQRDAKEVMAIKTANLDQETQQLSARLQTEVHYLATLRSVLEAYARNFEQEKAEGEKAGRNILSSWVGTEMRGLVYDHLEDFTRLIGPGAGIARMIYEWQQKTLDNKSEPKKKALAGLLPDPPKGLLEQLESVENRLIHQGLQRGLPPSLKERFRESLNVKKVWNDFVSEWKEQIEAALQSLRTPSFVGFRLKQYLAYFVIFLLFSAALVGEDAGRFFILQPGWASFLQAGFSFLQRLFSMTGLGAMLSCGLINILVGLRFHNQYKARVEKKTDQYITILADEQAEVWSRGLVRLEEALWAFEQELASHIKIIKH